jgi:anti-anti-sigma factor
VPVRSAFVTLSGVDGDVSIDVSARDGVTVVSLGGEIDMANAGSVARRVRAADDSSAPLVLDLGSLGYIDSAGIRMLFDLSEQLAKDGRRLVIAVAGDAPVRRALAITKLDTLVRVRDALDDAVHEARAEPA